MFTRINCSVLILLYLALWVVTTHGATRNSTCKLPPQPSHGSYISDAPEGASPNDGHLKLDVAFACHAGYEVVGTPYVTCRDGAWSAELPKCFPICKVEDSTVVQCETQKCVLPQDIGKTAVLDRSALDDKACGRMVDIDIQIIAGGEPVPITELPWHAAIYTKTMNPYMQICGGTLISNTIIISAAHCFWSPSLSKVLPASDYAVAVGKRYRPWDAKRDTEAQKSDVKEIITPPYFHEAATNFQADIALLKLSSPVSYSSHVQPICLDFDPEIEKTQLQPGSFGKVGGWSFTSEDGRSSPELKAVELPYIPIQQCIEQSPLAFIRYITSDKMCAGLKNGRGDSGGGLVFSKNQNQFVLRGIISTAPSHGDHLNHTWALFTMVSSHERFIKDQLSAQTVL